MKGALIHPDDPRKAVWDTVVYLFTILTAFEAPLQLVMGPALASRLLFLDGIFLVIFGVDMVVRARTAQRMSQGRLETRPGPAFRLYLRRYFAVDFMAVMPWTWLAAALEGPPHLLGNGMPDLWSIHALQLLSIFRIFRLRELTKRLESGAFVNPNRTRLITLLFWAAVMAHWLACGWYWLLGDSTLELHGENYLKALYFVMTTITTIGYGDITPKTNPQIIYTMVVQIFGAGFYGYLIGNLASILANMDVLRTQFRERVDRVGAFMSYHHLPSDLQGRIRKYYSHLWEVKRGQDAHASLSDLPVSLRDEVILEINRPILEKIPFLRDAPEELLRDIVPRLDARIAVPGETIFKAGDAGDELYIVQRGEVEVVSADGTQVYASIGEGGFFGEIALLFDSPRTATVRASDFSDLYRLTRRDFDKALQSHPKFNEQVRVAAEARRQANLARR